MKDLPQRVTAFFEGQQLFDRFKYVEDLKNCGLMLKDINPYLLVTNQRPENRGTFSWKLGDTVSINRLLITHALCAENLIDAEALAGLSEIAASKSKCNKSRKAFSDYRACISLVTDEDIKLRTAIYKKAEYFRVLGALTHLGECAEEFIIREHSRMLVSEIRVAATDPIRTDDFSYEETIVFWCKVGLWCCDNGLTNKDRIKIYNDFVEKVGGSLNLSSIIQVEARARALISAYTRLKDDEDTFGDFCKLNISMREDVISRKRSLPKCASWPGEPSA